MLLHSVCTFLCVDAAGWTAIFTGLLVLVTYLLWTNAQKQLAEQRQTTIILNKPYFSIENPMLGPTKLDLSGFGISFVVRNRGKSAAWDIYLKVRCYIKGNIIEPVTNLKWALLGADEKYIVIVPLEEHQGRIENVNPPLVFVVTFSYKDLEKPDNEYSFVANYDYERKTWQLAPGAIINESKTKRT
jgi:hypothetical protein